jgi:hypothetical protein
MTNDVLAAFNAEVMRLTTQYQQHNGEPMSSNCSAPTCVSIVIATGKN